MFWLCIWLISYVNNKPGWNYLRLERPSSGARGNQHSVVLRNTFSVSLHEAMNYVLNFLNTTTKSQQSPIVGRCGVETHKLVILTEVYRDYTYIIIIMYYYYYIIISSHYH
jgi:hypothetical protein